MALKRANVLWLPIFDRRTARSRAGEEGGAEGILTEPPFFEGWGFYLEQHREELIACITGRLRPY